MRGKKNPLMARSIFCSYMFSHDQLKNLFRGLLFIPTSLALVTSFLIFSYISSTSKLLIIHRQQSHLDLKLPTKTFSTINLPLPVALAVSFPADEQNNNLTASLKQAEVGEESPILRSASDASSLRGVAETSPSKPAKGSGSLTLSNVGDGPDQSPWSQGIIQLGNEGKKMDNGDVFHDRDLFLDEYKEMKRSLKIYVYPHKLNDPFANVLLPEKGEPRGNYASESYFKKTLFKSHFITNDPLEADLFYLPFSIASLRHDRRVGVGGIQNFIKDYILNISHSYPYWNRTGGADHFYVACHSVGRSAMDKAIEVKLNAIQVVCSSSYFLSGYVAHKDASIPQIWPRKGEPKNRPPSKRKKLAFYAGAMNSRERQYLVHVWGNDSDLSVHSSRLKTPYSEALLGSKFCIHAKGFEVNTARIGDAIYYGCVPVILADHYDLPFADILNWKSFSVVLSTMDIPLLKRILQDEISFDNYLRLQENVLKVQKHFRWHDSSLDFDAFHMVMYELWIRRSHLRIATSNL